VERARVARIEAAGGAYELWTDDGRLIATADVVCLATGAELGALWPAAPTSPVRGQLTLADGLGAPAAAWSAYVAPSRTGVVFGATFDRGDTDDGWRAEDDGRNLAALAARLPRLATRAGEQRLAGRASVRATTRDHLPLAGRLAPGLFVLGGLGSRGFTLAPLLAEHVVALALGSPSPLPADLQSIVRPQRFAERAGS
jgi:tRNA 5-methylaminomethyl-2-thiouridine biosynthesis bifunctional protein